VEAGFVPLDGVKHRHHTTIGMFGVKRCDHRALLLVKSAMEFRQLGKSGLEVPVLCFGTATFGGENEFFRAWGATDVAEATRLIDLCMEAGVNFFDTADVYSQGLSEEILGEAIKHLPRAPSDFDQGDLSLWRRA
jgi:hypothetical protein